jgi:soluble lytic murein transglycosylase-like protein
MRAGVVALSISCVLLAAGAVELRAPGLETVMANVWVVATGHPDAEFLARVAAEAGVPRLIMWAVAYEESRNNTDPTVVSVKGARGRMQIMQATARAYCPGYDIDNYEENVRCGARILRAHRDELGSWESALKRYQGGGSLASRYRDRVLATIGVFAVRIEEMTR